MNELTKEQKYTIAKFYNLYLTGEILDDNIYNISILNKTFIEFEQNFGWTWMSQL